MASDALPDTVIVPETGPPVGLPIETDGGTLSTMTDTGADVVWFPAPSVARAVSTCVPLLLPPVAHVAVNGAAVSGAPSGTLSTRNCTLATVPELSLAVAAIVAVPATSAPPSGLVIETVGGVVSGGGAPPTGVVMSVRDLAGAQRAVVDAQIVDLTGKPFAPDVVPPDGQRTCGAPERCPTRR